MFNLIFNLIISDNDHWNDHIDYIVKKNLQQIKYDEKI